MMIRVVHFAKFYFPDKGGIEAVTYSLASRFSALGHSVTVICFDQSINVVHKEVINNVLVIRCPSKKVVLSQPFSLIYIYLCIKYAKNADIVHLHTPNMLAAFSGLFIRSKCKLLLHWHSDVINKGLLGKLIVPLERILLIRANVILCTSKAYAETSKALLPFMRKVKILPIGIPGAKLQSSYTDQFLIPQHLARWIDDRKVIISVGRLVSYKGFEVLIEAAQHIQDAVIVIVGDGVLRERLQAKIDGLELSSRVYLAGRLTDDVLRALFLKSFLYCMPSITRAEAFGVVLLEAMTYGLPIVATKISGSGVPWVNMHMESGLNVQVENPLEMATACNRILSSDSLRREFSEGALGRYRSLFTEESSVKKLTEIYSDLLC